METGHPIPTRCPACGGRNFLLRRQFVTWDTHAVEGGEFIERFGGVFRRRASLRDSAPAEAATISGLWITTRLPWSPLNLLRKGKTTEQQPYTERPPMSALPPPLQQDAN